MNKQEQATQFMGTDFLLKSKMAQRLYHEYASKMPIIDYHCHLDPKLIAEDYQFSDITELWLQGDHYKWRIMRANGVAEKYITGETSTNREKFQYWAETLSKAYGNPLYHWTHLELQRYFDYYGVLSPETAGEVWELCNEKLASPDMSARQLILRSNVKVVATTDDPIHSLESHIALKKDTLWAVSVLPSWRPDKVLNIDAVDFSEYIQILSQVAELPITSLSELEKALTTRIDFFHEHGCRASDHGLNKAYGYLITPKEAEVIFNKALRQEALTSTEVDQYKSYILLFMAEEYTKKGWVMQLHFAAKRNGNSKMFKALGPDTGFDCIGESININHLTSFLDQLEEKNALPKTVLYSVNPNDEQVLASVLNLFQESGIKNKIQLGVPWWFNDTKSNMEAGLITLANGTLLGNFIGMLTDSRSFVSYPRHEYFRRILCNLLGDWMENGEIPSNIETVGAMVEDICYNNANRYFNFNSPSL